MNDTLLSEILSLAFSNHYTNYSLIYAKTLYVYHEKGPKGSYWYREETQSEYRFRISPI